MRRPRKDIVALYHDITTWLPRIISDRSFPTSFKTHKTHVGRKSEPLRCREGHLTLFSFHLSIHFCCVSRVIRGPERAFRGDPVHSCVGIAVPRIQDVDESFIGSISRRIPVGRSVLCRRSRI